MPELVGTYLESARLLGLRTAELHLALAADANDPEFAPEPCTTYYQRSLYQSMRNTARHSLQKLRDELSRLPADGGSLASRVLDLEPQLLRRFQSLLALRVSAARIRCHGDYGLGQVLHTGKDFMIVDFEGHPATGGERAPDQAPGAAGCHRDAVLVSLCRGYGADAADSNWAGWPPDERHRLARWADCWRLWVSVAFLKGYLDTLGRSSLLPARDDELQALLEIYLLHRTTDELGDHLATQPALVKPACEGILELLQPHPVA